MAILLTSDFSSGAYAIPQDKFTLLAPYIAKYERECLLKLLGSELYDLFILDLTAGPPQIPQAAKYLTIFNAFNKNIGGDWYQSEGIKEFLKQFVYFHWMRDSAYKKTTFGVTTAQPETGNNIVYSGFNLEEAYNQGASNAMAIQIYIQDNPSDYPTFMGDLFEYTSGI